MRAFRDITPYSLVGENRLFRVAYLHQSDDGGSTHL
jgi:hypothetical protein